MRKFLPVAVLALVALGSEAGWAQSPISISSSVFGGVVFPTGDNRSALNTGFTGGIAADVGAILLPLGARAEASYTRFGFKDNVFGATGNSSDVSGRINAVLGIPSIIISPYLIGGLGIYHVMSSGSSSGVTSSASTNRFGWNIGAGIDLPLLVFAGRLEARYHNVSTDGGKYSYMPVTVGIRF